MALRFRRRIKILPGVNLNIGKTGVSTSLGVRGASVTLGKRSRINAGLPGTGLSVSQSIGRTPSAAPQVPAPAAAPRPSSRLSATFSAALTFLIAVALLQLAVLLPLMLLVSNATVFAVTMSISTLVAIAAAWSAARITYRRERGGSR